MRIWDVPPRILCRQHLLGEHRELHGLWNVLALDKKGYRNHPETVRWEGRLGALRLRHDALVDEMARRGYNHGTPLPETPPGHVDVQDVFVDDADAQMQILMDKPCPCPLDPDD